MYIAAVHQCLNCTKTCIADGFRRYCVSEAEVVHRLARKNNSGFILAWLVALVVSVWLVWRLYICWQKNRVNETVHEPRNADLEEATSSNVKDDCANCAEFEENCGENGEPHQVFISGVIVKFDE